MFGKKKKTASEQPINNINNFDFEATDRDDIIDQDSINEADVVISAMASKRRNEKNKKKDKAVEEEPKTIKFGVIEETDPVEELTPLYDTNGPLESVINANAFNELEEEAPLDLEELTPLNDIRNGNNMIEDRNIFGQRNSNDFVSEPMSEQRFTEPSYDEPTSEDLVEEKPKKAKKEKKPKDPVKRMNIIFTIGILIVVIGAILFALWPTISNKLTGDNGGSQTEMTNTIGGSDINSVDGDSEGLSFIINLEPKLGVINNPDVITLNDSINYIGKMNKAIAGHMNTISAIIVENKGVQAKTLENEMLILKDSIQKDIAALKGYKPIFQKFGNLLIIERVKERLENAYKLADSTKNTMTDKAMVENANYYIEIEKKLNEKTTEEIIKFLEINEISHEVKDGHIQYIPVVNESLKAATGVEIPDVNIQVNGSVAVVGEEKTDNSLSDRDNIID